MRKLVGRTFLMVKKFREAKNNGTLMARA